MKKLLLILFIYLGLIGSANAVSSVDESFASLCIADSSTGYNWEKNDWERVNFTPGEKDLVKRINPSDTYDYECRLTKDRDRDSYFTVTSTNKHQLGRYGCYIIKPFGADYSEYPTDCNETWSTFKRVSDDIDPKIRRLESVQCWDRNFYFSPNGRFHKATLHGDVSNISKYKDSLSLTEGKCSTL